MGVPKSNTEVPVLLWELDPRDIPALNRYEGFPHLYRQEEIPIELDGNQTFIDTNNMPNAVEFLESIKGVEPVTENGVPVTAKSGFCEYPLFEFSEELLADMDLKGYMEHIHNYDRALTDMTKEMTMGG